MWDRTREGAPYQSQAWWKSVAVEAEGLVERRETGCGETSKIKAYCYPPILSPVYGRGNLNFIKFEIRDNFRAWGEGFFDLGSSLWHQPSLGYTAHVLLVPVLPISLLHTSFQSFQGVARQT